MIDPGDSSVDDSQDSSLRESLPVEIEFYIEPDGTVTFADLAADIVPVAQALNPDQPLLCDVPPLPQPDSNPPPDVAEDKDDA